MQDESPEPVVIYNEEYEKIIESKASREIKKQQSRSRHDSSRNRLLCQNLEI